MTKEHWRPTKTQDKHWVVNHKRKINDGRTNSKDYSEKIHNFTKINNHHHHTTMACTVFSFGHKVFFSLHPFFSLSLFP